MPGSNAVRPSEASGFEWRASLGAWRWLIVAAVGVGASDCGGETTEPPGQVGPSPCEGETALEGGLKLCSNGLVHRETAGVCSEPWSAPPFSVPPGDITLTYPGACSSDADCASGPYGHCIWSGGGLTVCAYGCVTDDDCEASQLCRCDDAGGQCVPSSCRSDGECGTGNLCASIDSCFSSSFLCQISSDECAVDADCSAGQRCVATDFGELNPLASPAGFYRACKPEFCPVIGRPFLVAGVVRSAARVERSDWTSRVDATVANPPALAPELRAAIARAWTEQALMEHASVAAFARFALQLLALGAPPDLVADAAAAMQDEIRHAQDCFRLARRHATADIGPGPLPIAGAVDECDLGAIVLGTVREGCIGETLAALEAAEALHHCEDEAARPVLERIAAEEARHAQLAWRFVVWALQTAPGTAASETLRASIQAAFDSELAETGLADPIGESDRELARHGLLSLRVRQALRARALSAVIAPCAQALLEPRRAHASTTEAKRPLGHAP